MEVRSGADGTSSRHRWKFDPARMELRVGRRSAEPRFRRVLHTPTSTATSAGTWRVCTARVATSRPLRRLRSRRVQMLFGLGCVADAVLTRAAADGPGCRCRPIVLCRGSPERCIGHVEACVACDLAELRCSLDLAPSPMLSSRAPWLMGQAVAAVRSCCVVPITSRPASLAISPSSDTRRTWLRRRSCPHAPWLMGQAAAAVRS